MSDVDLINQGPIALIESGFVPLEQVIQDACEDNGALRPTGATDAEIYRVAITNAGSHLGQWSKSALTRDAGRIGLGGVPAVFTEEDVRRVWKEIDSIGRALQEAKISPG